MNQLIAHELAFDRRLESLRFRKIQVVFWAVLNHKVLVGSPDRIANQHIVHVMLGWLHHFD